MSEEKDKHTDIETLFTAKTFTFLNTQSDILKADSTRPEFASNDVEASRIILPTSSTHDIDQKHSTINEKNHFDFFNGSFAELITAAISEAGGTVTLTIGRSGGGVLTGRFVSGYFELPDNSTIALTVGSDTSAQVNYIYILESAPTTLVKSTVDWPWTEDHIKITKILCPSATFVQNNGVYSFHLWNDENANTIFQGHEDHITDRLRAMGPLWDEGVTGNGTQGYLTPTSQNVELISTAGEVYQMHRHAIPAFTTAGTDKVLVKNWSGTAYKAITNLYDIIADSGGNAIGATKWFKIVLWGVANLGTSSFHPMIINLPSSFYNTQTACENDADDTIDTTIPDDFRGTGYLIASIVIQRADTWVIGSTKDLRGQTAATIGGGGSRYTNLEAIAAVEAAGLALASSKVITSANEDLIFLFGRAGFNSINTDRMTLAHRDMNNDTDYAISQNAVGDTFINAKTGRKVWFLINGITGIMTYSASGLQMGLANARINEFSTDGTLGGDSDVAVPTEKAVKTYADTKVTGAGAIAALEGNANVFTLLQKMSATNGGGDVVAFQPNNTSSVAGSSTSVRFTVAGGDAFIKAIRTANNNGMDLSFQLDEPSAGTLTERMRMTEAGDVGIGMVPTVLLELALDEGQKPSTNTWTITPCGRDFKKDIENYTLGLATLMNIRPRQFKYEHVYDLEKTHDMEKTHVGIIAEEMELVVPSTIGMGKRNYNFRQVDTGEVDEKTKEPILKEEYDTVDAYTYNSHDLTYIMINAIKELKQENDDMRERLIKLEGVK